MGRFSIIAGDRRIVSESEFMRGVALRIAETFFLDFSTDETDLGVPCPIESARDVR